MLTVLGTAHCTALAATNEYYETFDYAEGVMAPNWKMGANTFTRGCLATVINRQYNLFYVGTKMNFPVTLTLPDGAFTNSKVLVSMEVEPVSMGTAKCPKLPSVYGMLDGNSVSLVNISAESGKLYYEDNSSGETKRVTIPVSVADGIKVKIGFVVDLTQKKYDLYIYSNGGEMFNVEGLDVLNKEVDNITGLELLFNGSTESANYIVDNVRLRNYSEDAMNSFVAYFSPNLKVNALTELCNTLRSDDIVMKIDNSNVIKNRKVQPVDENDSSVAPIIRNSTTMVPIRLISEAFDAIIEYDETDNSVYVLYKNTELKIYIGSKQYLLNGSVKYFDEAPELHNGRTLVPVRAICETFGKKVLWDNSGIVVISRWEKLFEDSGNISNINVILD